MLNFNPRSVLSNAILPFDASQVSAAQNLKLPRSKTEAKLPGRQVLLAIFRRIGRHVLIVVCRLKTACQEKTAWEHAPGISTGLSQVAMDSELVV